MHGEFSRLSPSKWRFVCINSEKCFRTVWKELAQEFPVIFDQCAEQTLWNTARDTELRRPLTQAEEMRIKTGIQHEQIAHDRLWNKRPDSIAVKVPTKTKAGVICLLEFKRMSESQLHRSSAVAQRRGAQEELNLFRGSPRKYRTHPRETSYENI